MTRSLHVDQQTRNSDPHVCILIATYNGARWLDEQLESIGAQTSVTVTAIASDDCSSDATPQVLENWSRQGWLQILPSNSARLGSAHRNFLRLIRDASLGNAEYVALSDQDDIWIPQKLSRAIDCLVTQNADAYSSDVLAFWPDGRQRLIRKSQRQRSQDYLFGSPGPGCTFVMSRTAFDSMRKWIIERFDQIQKVWVHDWLIYAYARAHGLKWHIDSCPNMLYRQHGANEIGVNSGWRAIANRWRHVRAGSYRRDVLAIANAVGDTSPVVAAVRRLSALDRLWLITHTREFRRSLADSILLGFLLVAMPKDNST